MPADIVVVGENPSLGENLAEFLAAYDFNVRLVRDMPEAESLRSEGQIARDAVLIDACSRRNCSAQRLWRAGPLNLNPLVVVGPRGDGGVGERLYHVALPLVASDVVRLLRELLTAGPRNLST